jgi:hypothetical protein
LRRLADDAQKGSAYPFPISKARLDSNDVERVAALLQHQPGGFDPQVLDRPGRCLTGFGAEDTAELTWTEICNLRRPLYA